MSKRELSVSNIASVDSSVKSDLAVAERDLACTAIGSEFAPDALCGDKAGTSGLLRKQAFDIGSLALRVHDIEHALRVNDDGTSADDGFRPYSLLFADGRETVRTEIKERFTDAEMSAFNMARRCARAPIYARLTSGRAGIITARHCNNCCCPICVRWKASNRRFKVLTLNSLIKSMDGFKGFKDVFWTFSTENLWCYYAPEGYHVISLALRLLTGNELRRSFKPDSRILMLFEHSIISSEVTYNLKAGKFFGTFNLHFHAFCRVPASAFVNPSARSSALAMPSVSLFRSEWIRAVKTACQILQSKPSFKRSDVYDYMVDWCKSNLSTLSDPFDGLGCYDFRRYVPEIRGKDYLNVKYEPVSGRSDSSDGIIETLSYTVKPASFSSIDSKIKIPCKILFSSLIPEYQQLQVILYFCTCEMFYGKRLVRYRGIWKSAALALGLSDSDDTKGVSQLDLDERTAYIFQVLFERPSSSSSVLVTKEYGKDALSYIMFYLQNNFTRLTGGFSPIGYKSNLELHVCGAPLPDETWLSDGENSQLEMLLTEKRITAEQLRFYRMAREILSGKTDLKLVRKVSAPSHGKGVGRVKRSGALYYDDTVKTPDAQFKEISDKTPFDE